MLHSSNMNGMSAVLASHHGGALSSFLPHDQMPSRVSNSSGAFKPVLAPSEDHSRTSAFVPPNKCLKIEPSDDAMSSLVDRSGVATPVSTDGSESGHRSTPEEGGRRLRGKYHFSRISYRAL